MTHEIPELDRKGLREFGIVTGSIIAVLFGLALPWLFNLGYPIWPWVLGGILIVWGLIAPQSLRPVYKVWMRFGLLLNRVTTPLILGLVFFVMITPLSILMRTFGRDTMARKLDKSLESYRVASVKPPLKNLEKPF